MRNMFVFNDLQYLDVVFWKTHRARSSGRILFPRCKSKFSRPSTIPSPSDGGVTLTTVGRRCRSTFFKDHREGETINENGRRDRACEWMTVRECKWQSRMDIWINREYYDDKGGLMVTRQCTRANCSRRSSGAHSVPSRTLPPSSRSFRLPSRDCSAIAPRLLLRRPYTLYFRRSNHSFFFPIQTRFTSSLTRHRFPISKQFQNN